MTSSDLLPRFQGVGDDIIQRQITRLYKIQLQSM